MGEKGCGILNDLSTLDRKRSRSLMIKSVLSTDMAKHNYELDLFKKRLNSSDYKPREGSDKDLTMTMLFHIADISNSTKPWHICSQWTELLFSEFFN